MNEVSFARRPLEGATELMDRASATTLAVCACYRCAGGSVRGADEALAYTGGQDVVFDYGTIAW